MISSDDLPFMKQAIEEAKRAMKKCPSDNPRIPRLGAVLVKNGKIIAKVYRCELNTNEHAEYMLLRKKLKVPSDAAGATLYVTLEPCSNRRFHEKYDKKSPGF